MARIWESSNGTYLGILKRFFSSKKWNWKGCRGNWNGTYLGIFKKVKLEGGASWHRVQRDRSYIRRKLKWHHSALTTPPLLGTLTKHCIALRTSLHFLVNNAAGEIKENLYMTPMHCAQMTGLCNSHLSLPNCQLWEIRGQLIYRFCCWIKGLFEKSWPWICAWSSCCRRRGRPCGPWWCGPRRPTSRPRSPRPASGCRGPPRCSTGSCSISDRTDPKSSQGEKMCASGFLWFEDCCWFWSSSFRAELCVWGIIDCVQSPWGSLWAPPLPLVVPPASVLTPVPCHICEGSQGNLE